MPSPFDDLHDEISGVIVDEFGETRAQLRPRINSEYKGRIADPARDIVLVYGVFTYVPADEKIGGSAQGEYSGPTRLATSAAEFWMSAASLALLPYEIAVGDLLVMLDRPNSPAFAVSRMQPSHMGDVNLILVKEE